MVQNHITCHFEKTTPLDYRGFSGTIDLFDSRVYLKLDQLVLPNSLTRLLSIHSFDSIPSFSPLLTTTVHK